MKFRCPKCSTTFESESASGGVVMCPNCRAKLKTLPAAAAPTPIPALVRRPVLEARPSRPPIDDEREDDQVKPRKPKKKRRRKSGGAVGFSFVGAALVILAIINLVARFSNGERMEDRMRAMNEEQARKDAELARKNPTPNFFDSPPARDRTTPASQPPTNYPELPNLTTRGDGIRQYAVSIPWGLMRKTDVRVYLPPKAGAPRSLPTIFIAPAGSNCLCGKALEEGDTPEHLPWAKAGFAVVAFSLSGPMPDVPDERAMEKAFSDFQRADAGLVDAKAAMEFAMLRIREIDANRLYAAGHSSAGSFALTFAAREPRIKGVAAFAAAIDLEERFGPAMAQLRRVPGFSSYFAKLDPKSNESKLACPVFLFHAADDDNVPISESENCERRLKQAGKDVTFVRTSRGGHSEAMMDEGIPAAIAWVKAKAAF
jgi:dienelactone hydrolase